MKQHELHVFWARVLSLGTKYMQFEKKKKKRIRQVVIKVGASRRLHVQTFSLTCFELKVGVDEVIGVTYA